MEIIFFNNEENSFTKNLEKSYEWFDEVVGKRFTIEEWERFYGKTIAKKVEFNNLKFDKFEKTAIILLGLSGTGKSTYAKKFVETFPDFQIVSYDDVEMDVFEEYLNCGFTYFNSDYIDRVTDQYFGKALEEYSSSNHNIIIDGLWLRPNGRGALINTLRDIGYERIILFSFLNQPLKVVEEMLVSRAISQIAFNFLKSTQDDFAPVAWKRKLQEYNNEQIAEMMGTSLEDLINSEEFAKEHYILKANLYETEPLDTGLPFQAYNDLFVYGADMYVELF